MTWKVPDTQTLRIAGDPDMEARRKEVKINRQDRLYKLTPRVGRNTEISRQRDILTDSFFTGFVKNYEYYVYKVTTKRKYALMCRDAAIYSNAEPVRAFKDNKRSAVKLDHVISTHLISGIPVGVLLMADVEYLCTAGVIRFNDKSRCEIHPAYQTDGFFFYGKYIASMFPIGNPKFAEFARSIHGDFQEPDIQWP